MVTKLEKEYDLDVNLAALILAVLSSDICIPEQAFAALYGSKYKLTERDTEDMIRMRQKGVYLKDIGEIYGLTPSGVYRKIERYYKKRK